MSERLIDANALEKALDYARLHGGGVRETVRNAPTIDAVAVVRCRDCKHGNPIRIEHKHRFSEGVLNCACLRADADCFGICAVWPDGYCDEGEPKEDA